MAKRKTKQKAGTQKPKRRKDKSAGGGGSSSGGTMSGLRGGFKGFFGGPKGKSGSTSRALDVVLWVAVIAAGYFFVSRQCAG